MVVVGETQIDCGSLSLVGGTPHVQFIRLPLKRLVKSQCDRVVKTRKKEKFEGRGKVYFSIK